MNNQIHNTRIAQSFFLFIAIQKQYQHRLHSSPKVLQLSEWMDGWMDGQMNGWMEGGRERVTNDLFKSALHWKKWLAMPLILNMLNWAKRKPFTRNVKDCLWGKNSEIVYAQTRISGVDKRLCWVTAQHTILDKAQSTAKHNSSYLPGITVYLALNPRNRIEPSVTKRTTKVSW